MAGIGAASQSGSSQVTAGNLTDHVTGNDTFGITLGGTNTLSGFSASFTIANGVTTMGGYSYHLASDENESETDSGTASDTETGGGVNDTSRDDYEDSATVIGHADEDVSGDANSCTVDETDRATDTFSDSAKDTGGGSEALGNDPLAATLDGGSGGTLLAGNSKKRKKGTRTVCLDAVAQAVGRNFERIIEAGRIIGTDRATGLPTQIYTVITNAANELITVFPGRP